MIFIYNDIMYLIIIHLFVFIFRENDIEDVGVTELGSCFNLLPKMLSNLSLVLKYYF